MCTSCGAVLDEHLRDEHAEWREYNNNNNNDAADKNVASRARCGGGDGSLVDEEKYVGGLMPTLLSNVPYSGGVARGTMEDRQTMSMLRKRLKRSHAIIEHMVERDQKRRYEDVLLEGRAREAKLERGEEQDVVMQDDSCGNDDHRSLTVGGDYEALIAQRRLKDDSTHREDARQFTALKDKKWSLADAIVLHGSLDEVQHWVPRTTATTDSIYNVESTWSHSTLERERSTLTKKLDANTRSSLHKLYIAFELLDKSCQKLELNGVGNATFREAMGWLMKYATKKDGLRVKGISSGLGTGNNNIGGGGEDAQPRRLLLSLLPFYHEIMSQSSTSKSTTTSTISLKTDLHRIKQYASLGAAIIYLSAKRTGVGRTLAEVCSSFGTFSIVSGTNDESIARVDRGGGGEEPLVRPKYCSRAMQELRTVLPEVVSSAGSEVALPSVSQSSSPVKRESDGDTEMKPAAVSSSSVNVKREPVVSLGSGVALKLPEGLARVGSSSSTSTEASSLSTKNNGMNSCVSSLPTTEEAALVDLTSRMARSLNLPPFATAAAIAVAVQCARNNCASSSSNGCVLSKPQRQVNKSPLFITRKRSNSCQRGKGRNASNRNSGTQKQSPDVVAAASLLLVCMAGGKMQHLARQALSEGSKNNQSGLIGDKLPSATVTNPLDELEDDASSLKQTMFTNTATGSSVSTNHQQSGNGEREATASWSSWNQQPPWHREVSQLEQCTGLPSKTVVSYYSNAMHPRRSYFLGVAKKRLEEERDGVDSRSGYFLRNIVAAVPLMSLRGLSI